MYGCMEGYKGKNLAGTKEFNFVFMYFPKSKRLCVNDVDTNKVYDVKITISKKK
jgi:hypothetical protein